MQNINTRHSRQGYRLQQQQRADSVSEHARERRWRHEHISTTITRRCQYTTLSNSVTTWLCNIESDGPRKISPSLMHRHFETACSRITLFSSKWEKSLSTSQFKICQLVKYSLINSWNWIHVMSDVSLHVNIPHLTEDNQSGFNNVCHTYATTDVNCTNHLWVKSQKFHISDKLLQFETKATQRSPGVKTPSKSFHFYPVNFNFEELKASDNRAHGWRFWHPWTRAVNTGACTHYPCSRPVNTALNTGSVCWALERGSVTFPV